MKRLLGLFAGLFLFAGGAALAVVGTAPLPNGGPALIDQTWLYGLAGGQNSTYQYGLTAAGTNQATSLQLPAGIALVQVDTAASGTGVALPTCVAGTELSIYNNGANPLAIYPAIANNPLTGSQDTINSGTGLTGGSALAVHTPEYFSCAKNGVWSAK